VIVKELGWKNARFPSARILIGNLSKGKGIFRFWSTAAKRPVVQ
jgi:hypothetical protein